MAGQISDGNWQCDASRHAITSRVGIEFNKWNSVTLTSDRYRPCGSTTHLQRLQRVHGVNEHQDLKEQTVAYPEKQDQLDE